MVLILFVMSIAIILSTQLFNEGMSDIVFARTSMNREKAKLLAEGGVQLAMSQLALTGSGEDQTKKFLEKILPALNRWQVFELKESVDGIDGTVKICISCEEGKLNLNKLYDFKNKKFLGENTPHDTKKLLGIIFPDLLEPLEKLLGSRGKPLDDATDLLNAKEFGKTFKNKIFYQPIEDAKQVPALYLLDLFTVDRVTVALQPWLLSDSWCGVFNLTRAKPGDIKTRQQEVKKWVETFKPNAKWAADWDGSLKNVYGKEFSTLPKGCEVALASQFGAQTFSVLSYGSVGAISQRIYAILQRKTAAAGGPTQYIVKRVYAI